MPAPECRALSKWYTDRDGWAALARRIMEQARYFAQPTRHAWKFQILKGPCRMLDHEPTIQRPIISLDLYVGSLSTLWAFRVNQKQWCAQDWSWDAPALDYIDLYFRALK